MAKWEELSMADRAQYMRVAVKNGYRDIRSIKEAYNKYEEGGPTDSMLSFFTSSGQENKAFK